MDDADEWFVAIAVVLEVPPAWANPAPAIPNASEDTTVRVNFFTSFSIKDRQRGKSVALFFELPRPALFCPMPSVEFPRVKLPLRSNAASSSRFPNLRPRLKGNDYRGSQYRWEPLRINLR